MAKTYRKIISWTGSSKVNGSPEDHALAKIGCRRQRFAPISTLGELSIRERLPAYRFHFSLSFRLVFSQLTRFKAAFTSPGFNPAALACARAVMIVRRARERPPASNASSGTMVSISTSEPDFSVHSSATISAIGCNVHCARWRCASVTRGPVVCGSNSAGKIPKTAKIDSRAAARLSRVHRDHEIRI